MLGKRAYLRVKSIWRHYWHRVRHFSHTHPITYRLICASLAVLILASAALPILDQLTTPRNYRLSAQTKLLTGEVRDDAKQYLKKDDKTGSYSFEVASSSKATDSSAHTGRVDDAYSTTFGTVKDGVTVTDTATKIAMTFRSLERTGEPKEVDQHIIYPLSHDSQLVYSLKYNGLKEDIIVPKEQGDKLSYEFELVLPTGVEARADEQGNINLYSGDTSLYGEISYGSDTDRASVDKAREKAAKTHLLGTIPAPIVKDANSKEYTDKAVFQLGDKKAETGTAKDANPSLPAEVQAQINAKATSNVYKLTIKARGLKQLKYPIAIDPTIQVTSASDFKGINPEGGSEIDSTNNMIRRGTMTGGELKTTTGWPGTRTATLGCGQKGTGVRFVAYNGYMYSLMANQPICSAPISAADGSLGAFSPTGVTPTNGSTSGYATTVYNGYIYLNNTSLDGVMYAQIQSGGRLGAFTNGGAFNAGPRTAFPLVAYNGYLYVVSGTNGSTGYRATSEYAKINADGSLGTWTDGGLSLPEPRREHGGIAYNGYLYAVGGGKGGVGGAPPFTQVNTSYYTKINSDGSLGNAWIQTTALAATNVTFLATINGYMYMSRPSNATPEQYAQINADGSLGAWFGTVSYDGGVTRTDGIWYAYNGYIYGGAGFIGASDLDDVYYTSVKSVGEPAAKTTGTSTTAGRWGSTGVVYNGRLYNIGGCTTFGAASGELDDCDTPSAVVDSAAINADGTMGAWTTTGMDALSTGSAPGARWLAKATVYNGWIYLSGGCTNGGSGVCTRNNDVHIIQIASDGTLGTWAAEDSFTTARSEHYLAASNNYLFVIGGADANGTQLATIQRSLIAADGTIGSWSSVTTDLATIYASGINSSNNAVVVGNRIYIVGPNINTTATDDVYFINVSSSGVMDANWTHTTDLPGTFGFGGVGLNNGYIYAIQSTQAYFASVASDGTVGAWTTTSAASALTTATVAFNAGFMYQFGGCGGTFTAPTCATSASNATAYTVINNGGSGMVTTSSTGSALTARHSHATLALNGYIYAIGGCTGTSATCNAVTGVVQKSTIADDGTLGAFSATSIAALNTARHGMGATVYNGRLYVSGGFTAVGGTPVTSLEYATPDASGNISAWTTDTGGDFSTARRGHTMEAYNGYIYVIGGDASGTLQTDVQYADLNTTTGAPQTWASAGTGFTTARSFHASALSHGYLYVLGGCSVSGSCNTNVLGDVQYRQIGSNGSLTGSWATAAFSFSQARYGFGAFAFNGYLYLAGGMVSGGTETGDIQYAPIMASGGLGTWNRAANGDFATPRQALGVVQSRGNIYLIGGKVSTASQSTVQRGILQSIVRVANFSKFYDFDLAVKPAKLVTEGTKQAGAVVGLTYATNKNLSGTGTASNASDNITVTAHGLANGQQVMFSGTMPTGSPGLTAGTIYYVVSATTNTFRTALTSGGSPMLYTSDSASITFKVVDNINYDTIQTITDAGFTGANAQTIPLVSGGTLARYLFVRYTIDDSLSAVFPDSGNETTMTDFDVYYRANTAKRLRGGRTFTGGTDRGLDAQP